MSVMYTPASEGLSTAGQAWRAAQSMIVVCLTAAAIKRSGGQLAGRDSRMAYLGT